jgi:hypothetical protein
LEGEEQFMTHAARRPGPQPPPLPRAEPKSRDSQTQPARRDGEGRSNYFDSLPQLGTEAFMAPLPLPPEPRPFWTRKLFAYCALGACAGAGAGLLVLTDTLSLGREQPVPEVGLGPAPPPSEAEAKAEEPREPGLLRAAAAEAKGHLARALEEERERPADVAAAPVPATTAKVEAVSPEDAAKPPAEPPPEAAEPAKQAREPRGRSAKRAAALPDKPSREQVIAAMSRIQPRVKACLPNGRGMATADVKVLGRTGRVTTAQVSGQSGAVGSCIARAVRGAKFPQFASESLTFRYPMAH